MARTRALRTADDNDSMSYAPWWRIPLTKNVGVPDTPDHERGLAGQNIAAPRA